MVLMRANTRRRMSRKHMQKTNMKVVVVQLASPADCEWHQQQAPVGAMGPNENRLSARSVFAARCHKFKLQLDVRRRPEGMH